MANDDQVVSYLLGDLSDAEIERLDELSVTDEQFAQRLREAEYDLVDGYVRGELAADLRERIDTMYGSSERGRSRLQFAAALHAVTRRRAQPTPAPRWSAVWRTMRSSALPVAATVVMAVASAVLLTSNARLRRDVQQLASQRDSLAAAGEQQRRELASPSPMPSPPPPATVSFVLPAPRRDAGSVPSIEVPRAADRLVLNLQLESNDFPTYYAALMRPASGEVLWRSGDLAASAGADGPIVPVTLPASILNAGRYALELHGRSRRGADEPLASYPIDIVVK